MAAERLNNDDAATERGARPRVEGVLERWRETLRVARYSISTPNIYPSRRGGGGGERADALGRLGVTIVSIRFNAGTSAMLGRGWGRAQRSVWGALVDMGRRGHEQGWPREELCATVCSRWHFKYLLSHW